MISSSSIYLKSIKVMSKDSPDYPRICANVFRELDQGQQEVLGCLISEGPLWIGDVPSKIATHSLIELGLATQVVFKGEQGYVAATYLGWDVYNGRKVLEESLQKSDADPYRGIRLRA